MAVKDPNDPRGLIRESFRIEGIGAPECRSIFLDWALGVPIGQNTDDMVRQLLERYADEPDDHPMKATLRAALGASAEPKRRGGRRGRMT